MAEQLWVQTELSRREGSGIVVQVVWLPADRRVRVGQNITLKDSKVRWRVMWQSYYSVPERLINKKWAVGGL